MNDKCRMQGILNHSLSGLKANPFLAQRIISQSDSRKPKKAKLSFIIICVITMLLIGTMTALAAGVENIYAICEKKTSKHSLFTFYSNTSKLATYKLQCGDTVPIGWH